MKMIYSNSATGASIQRPGCKSSFAAFFFHDRGSQTQKSLEGLLKEILHQVLKDIPELRIEAFHLYSSARKKYLFSWELRNLIELFRRIVLQTERDVVIFLCLDALDEYVGPHKDMIKFILEACSASTAQRRTRIKVCFSSRPEQLFLDSFDAVPGISIHEHTADDIWKVVDQEFKANPRMFDMMSRASKLDRDGIERIRSRILFSAKGVFLWVRLILDELLSDYTAGRSLDELYEKLESLPKDLNAFYAYLISKKIPSQYAKESRVMFDLVLSSIRPLPLVKFMTTFRLADLEDLSVYPSGTRIDLDESERLIRTLSGGLIEVRSLSTQLDRSRPKSRPLPSHREAANALFGAGHIDSKLEATLDPNKEENCILTSEHRSRSHVDAEPSGPDMPVEQGRCGLERYEQPLEHDLTSYEVQFLHQTVKAFARTTMEQASQNVHFGCVSILKFYLYTIHMSRNLDKDEWLSRRYADEDFLQYLQLADSVSQQSQLALLRQAPVPKLCKFLMTASTRRSLTSISGLLELAILAKAPRTLAELINLQLSVRSPFKAESKRKSEYGDSNPFLYFCKCYLWSHSYGDPREILEILLRKNWGEDAIWNVLSELMDAERGILQSPKEIHEVIVIVARKALKLGVNPDYVLPPHDSHSHNTPIFNNHDTAVRGTYLIKAVIISKNPTPVIQLLLKHKVNLRVKDEQGATPLKHAVDAYIYAAINVLEGHASPESVQEYYARFDTARLLLDNDAPVSAEYPVRYHLLPEQQELLERLGYPTDERFGIFPERCQ